MDNFMKALKMYIRTAVRPITLVFGLGVPISMIAAMVADPAKQGEKDYGSMIACMGMMHAILLILFFIGNISISQMKFFGSLPQVYTFHSICISSHHASYRLRGYCGLSCG